MILPGEDSYSTGDQACEPPAKRDPCDRISKIGDHECMDHFRGNRCQSKSNLSRIEKVG